MLSKVAVGAAVAVLGATLGAVPATASSLVVDGHCDTPYGGIGHHWEFECSASASGGTGSYRYSWQQLIPFVYFDVDQGPVATGYCSAYNTVGVRVTVTSGAETTTRDIRFDCHY
ncbi:hypothetical protein ACIBJE_08750 [Micromonospora sp. NPDC050187]|uniref:hypothetical protein n=1 Tax=Micromonospora sp. NPDC050187 TaxID=3364277 RepID=UPI00379BD71E